MTKGKPWTIEEEKQLRQMLADNKSVKQIARVLCKNRQSVRINIDRLDLKEEGRDEKSTRPTSIDLNLPAELPSIEEKLKVLAAAVDALKTVGLDKKSGSFRA
jgi:hypothetical protein